MINKRTLGLNFTSPSEANIRVWAPTAGKVSLELEQGAIFNLLEASMGFWELTNIRVNEGDLYRIIVDGKAFPDPASLLQPEGVHKQSQAFNLNKFPWCDDNWKGPTTEELIIYELHTGTFSSEGTFDGITGKLDYQKELGITAIELMPVAQFPGNRNWGYDGVYPFAVHNTYGGPERLQNLVDSCHKKGLAVILDVVYNHLGPEGNYLPAFGPVFTGKYTTPWGMAINFDDEWCDGIRTLFIENVLMWLRDFHIDGLRLDAVHAIKDFSAKHILREMKEKVEELNFATSKNHFLICESDLNDIGYISPFNQGGYGMDATWCDEFHHSLHALTTGENKGYYSDFGKITHLAKSLENAFVYDGQWSEHRKRKFGTKTSGLAGNNFVVFTQNHDQVGNRMSGDRLSTMLDFELLKVIAGTMLLSPFIPLIFMGEEYAETNPFLYFIDHGDEELIRLVREGRKKEFEAFMNSENAPDPDDIKTFNDSKLNWEHRSSNQKHIFDFYKELIQLRKTIAPLKNRERKSYSAKTAANKNIIEFERINNDQRLIAVLNFEPEQSTFTSTFLNTKNAQLLLCSSDKKWGGNGTTASLNLASEVTIPPSSLAVWLTS